MPADLKTACRMAKAADVPYYSDQPGGPVSCPFYGDVGFTAPPQMFIANQINAALVGTTGTEVVLAFRGTLPIETDNWDAFVTSLLDWVNDGEAKLIDVPYTLGQVHQGFARSLDLLWDDVLPAVKAQQTASKLPIVVTGHSKGGALASLAALRLQHDAALTPAAVYTYGSARAGNSQFARDFAAKILRDWRFENRNDLVPHLPPVTPMLAFLVLADPRLAKLSAHGYQHVGTLEFLNWDGGLTEGSTLTLDGQRLIHFAELAAALQILQVALDHSLEKQYIPKICGMA
jgi:hypothetical protein